MLNSAVCHTVASMHSDPPAKQQAIRHNWPWIGPQNRISHQWPSQILLRSEANMEKNMEKPWD